VAISVVVAAVPASAAPDVAAQTPLSCPTERAFFSAGTPTQLNEVVGSPGSVVVQPIGTTSHGITYNALGFRPTDGLFYAINTGASGAGDLVQIDAAGTTQDLGATTPALPRLVAGTFDAAGTYFVATVNASILNTGNSTLYEVDIPSRTVTTVALTFSTVPDLLPDDFVFIGGKLWGEQLYNHDDYFIRIDPATGKVDQFLSTALPANLHAGAAWARADGSLNLVDNPTGTFYQVAIGSPNSASPSFTPLAAQAHVVPAQVPGDPFDATSCLPNSPPAPPVGTGPVPEHHSRAGSNDPGVDPSNDPANRALAGADPPPSPTAPNTATASCSTVRGVCSVRPPAGPDSAFSVTARGGGADAVLFGTLYGGSRPVCPGYAGNNRDWLRFGFLDPAPGAGWTKTASLTTTHELSRRDALGLLGRMQLCFDAPYSFPTRPGYELGTSGPDRAGVLPECGPAAGHDPCVLGRALVRRGHGWAVRLRFRVPAGRQDPKALG